MPSAASESWVTRFRNECAALIGEQAIENHRFGVAVSGGPDSVALLWLASQAFQGRTHAATVDHQLRVAARDEAEMVALWCANAKLPHAILVPKEPISGSIQSAARSVRYALLESWREANRLDWIMTAHHADDQLETVLMRLNRSSGVAGLSGIRAVNGAVLRPLLGWKRAELANIVRVRQLPHVLDPSNDDSRFDRVEMRKHLTGVEWLDPIAASRSAGACADAEDALVWLVNDIAAKHLHSPDDECWILDCHDFPREVQRRLIIRLIATADPDSAPTRGDTIDQALVQLLCGKKVSIGRWLISGGKQWTLRAAPPRNNQ